MLVLFRLAYAVTVAILFILFVIFGTRTFYDEPEFPAPTTVNPQQQAQSFEEYQEENRDYHRNVFIFTSILGVAAVGAALYLYKRVDALPLGLMLGGLGVLIYGWVQLEDEADELDVAPVFAVVTVCLLVAVGAG